MPTDTNLSQLVINELTKEQYLQASSEGSIVDTELYFITDDTQEITQMTGSTSSAAGTSGLVPAPAAGDQDKFLKGDGTWGEVAGGSLDENAIADLELITLDDIHEICYVIPANTFQKVRAFQDGKEYILLFGYNGAYYYLSNEAFNDWTVLAKATSDVTNADAQITFATVPTLFTARASGDGFTLHNGENNVYAYAQSNGTGLRVNTETAAVFTVDTSATGGFDSDEYIAKVDDQAVWLRSAFDVGSACLKFESANLSVGIDYKDRDATYSTGFVSFILYEKIS